MDNSALFLLPNFVSNFIYLETHIPVVKWNVSLAPDFENTTQIKMCDDAYLFWHLFKTLGLNHGGIWFLHSFGELYTPESRRLCLLRDLMGFF